MVTDSPDGGSERGGAVQAPRSVLPPLQGRKDPFAQIPSTQTFPSPSGRNTPRPPLPLGEGQGEGTIFTPTQPPSWKGRALSTAQCISLSILERRRRRDQVFPSRWEMGRDRGDMLLAKVW